MTSILLDISRQRLFFAMLLVTVPGYWPASAIAGHRVLTQGNGQLVLFDAAGQVEWSMKWGPIHDLHRLPNGHIFVQQGRAKIVEIDPRAKRIIWSYDAAQSNGNQGRKVEIHAFQPLADGRMMIAESGPARIIEIDRQGRLLKSIPLKTDNPSAHSDTRLVRKFPSGNYLVAHEADGYVREYDAKGQVVWSFEVPLFGQAPRRGHGPDAFGNRLFSAIRLKNGNTLIGTGNGHSVLEVTPEKKIVWKLTQNELPGIRLAWVTTLQVLPNGNYVIGNCHAGAGQPQLVEVNPRTKRVVWTLEKFKSLGNNVSNSLVLNAK